MAQGTIAPFPFHQFFTSAGAVASGYLVFTYAAGTSTPLATYSNAELTSANTNPIQLDSAGRAKIFLTSASYKFDFCLPTDLTGATPIWSIDGVSATAPFFQDINVQGTAGEALAAGDGVYMSAGDGALTAGRWYKWDSDLTYASANANAVGMVPEAIASGEVGSIRIAGRITGLAGLVAGTPYYIGSTAGGLQSNGPANARTVGVADSTTSIILSHTVIPQQDVMGRSGEDLAEGNVVYLSEGQGGKTAGRWYKADDTNGYSSVSAPLIGICKMAILSGATGPITTIGRQGGFSLTAGQDYYVGTSGVLTAAPGTNRRLVGFADSTGSLRMNPGQGYNYQRNLKTSDQLVNSATLADADGLKFAIGESETWNFRFYLFINVQGGYDLKLKLTVPAAATSVAYGVRSAGGSGAAEYVARTTATTLGPTSTDGSSNATTAFTGDQFLEVFGVVVNGANAGSVQLQWAENVASTDTSNMLYSGSYVVAEMIRGN